MNNCKYCKADCALRGEENLKECKGHIQMTNADRIRAMSDEELSKFLSEAKFHCQGICKNCLRGTACIPMLQWLQQPAEKPMEELEENV